MRSDLLTTLVIFLTSQDFETKLNLTEVVG